MAKKHVQVALEPRLLDIKAASAYLSCSVWYMRTLVWERRVPSLKLGHKILFDKADLDRFVDAAKQGAV